MLSANPLNTTMYLYAMSALILAKWEYVYIFCVDDVAHSRWSDFNRYPQF